jgi:transposase
MKTLRSWRNIGKKLNTLRVFKYFTRVLYESTLRVLDDFTMVVIRKADPLTLT